MVLNERLNEVVAHALDKGKHSAAYKYNLEVATVERYIRLYIQHNKQSEPAPKILIFDIETLPILAVTWGVWKVNIPPVNIIKDWSLLSYSYKWFSEEKVYGDVLTPQEALARNDERIVKEMWDLLNEADIVIGYNSKKFDERKLNAKFIEYGLQPPSPYKSIDLYQAVKTKFANTFNRMDWVNKIIGIDRKLEHTGMQLWIDCLYGDEDALHKMIEYNMVDVEITEQLYIKILSWIPNHPNMALYYSDDVPLCHKCASKDVVPTAYRHTTSASVFDVYCCPDCGSFSRYKKRISTTDLRPV